MDVGDITEPVSPEEKIPEGIPKTDKLTRGGETGSESDISDEGDALLGGDQVPREGHRSHDSDQEIDIGKQVLTVIEKQPGPIPSDPASPTQSSISDVSSEDGREMDHIVSKDQEKGDNWEQITDSHFELGFTGIGSPKEEKLDYGGMDEDEHGNVRVSLDAYLGSGSKVLDRRKSGSPELDGEIANDEVPKDKDSDGEDGSEHSIQAGSDRAGGGGLMERVSDQSDNEMDKSESIWKRDGSVDNVSEQSGDEGKDSSAGTEHRGGIQRKDGSIDSVSEEEADIPEAPEPFRTGNAGNDSIDDVSDQSEVEDEVDQGRHHSGIRTAVNEMLDNVSDQSAANSPKSPISDEPPSVGIDRKKNKTGTSGKQGMMDDVSDEEPLPEIMDHEPTQTQVRNNVSEQSAEDMNEQDGTKDTMDRIKDESVDNVSDKSEVESVGEVPLQPAISKVGDNVSDQSDNESEGDKPPEPVIKKPTSGIDDDMMDNVSDQSDDELTVEQPSGPSVHVARGDMDNISDDQSGDESLEKKSSEPLPIDIKADMMEHMSSLSVGSHHRVQSIDESGRGVGELTTRGTDGADLEDVSDQSDLEIDEEPVNNSKVGTASSGSIQKGLPQKASEVQEDLDNVSDAEPKETVQFTDEGKGQEEELEEEHPKIKKIHKKKKKSIRKKETNDVNDMEDENIVVKTTEATVEGLGMPTPNEDVVMEVHHHGDELDYEEDMEDRRAQDKAKEEEGKKKEQQAETKLPEAEDDTDGELESGEEEEGETKDLTADDAGEIEEEEEEEEGEVRDPEDRKPVVKRVCRFYTRGHCTWGASCRFLHPGFNNLGNYSFIDFKEMEKNTLKLLNKATEPPPQAEGLPDGPAAEDIAMMEEFLPPPPMHMEPQRESAWERGIRQAKEARKRLQERKAMGMREEPAFIIEETFEDFDMEAEFNPDLRREDDPRFGEPDPRYNPRFHMRDRHHEMGPPRREPPPQYKDRPPPPPYMERKYPEPPPARKDKFGRDYSKRQEMYAAEQERRKQIMVARQQQQHQQQQLQQQQRYPPRKPPPGIQERGRREERGRPPQEKTGKPADDWQDPWARNKSPKPKTKPSAKGRTRPGSLSSGSSGSRSRSRSYSSGSSRSSSGSSFSSRSSRSRSRSPRKTKPTTTKLFGLLPRERAPLAKTTGPVKTTGVVKMGLQKTGPVKLGLQPAPGKKPPPKPIRRSMSNSSISSTSRSPSPQLVPPAKQTKAAQPKAAPQPKQQPKTQPRAQAKPQPRPQPKPQAKSQPKPQPPGANQPPERGRRRRSSSGSSHVSLNSRSSADSEHMYANLASPVSSPSSSERKSKKKAARVREKFPSSKPSRPADSKAGGKDKRMVTVPSMEEFQEPIIHSKKSKPSHPKAASQSKPKSTSAPAQMTRHPVKHSTHKEIKLTLLNKPSTDGKKRYEVLGDGSSKKVKPVAPVKPTAKVAPEKERRAVKPLQQSMRKATPSAVVAPVRTAAVKPSVSERSERKRPPSPFKQRDQPPSKQAHKAAPAKSSNSGKGRDTTAVKKATISRREEILKQLKAVEDMIARKKAKMKT